MYSITMCIVKSLYLAGLYGVLAGYVVISRNVYLRLKYFKPRNPIRVEYYWIQSIET
jgi:hypothetical protein